MKDDLKNKFEDLKHQVNQRVDEADNEETPSNSFLEIILEALEEESIVIGGPIVEYSKTKSGQIRGYAINEEEKRLDIFDVKYLDGNSYENIPQRDIEIAQKRMENFVKDLSQGIKPNFDLSNQTKKIMVDSLTKLINEIEVINIIFITNGTTRLAERKFEKNSINNSTVGYQVWDLGKINNIYSSNVIPDAVEINFDDEYSERIYCIPMEIDDDKIEGYIGVISGYVLSDLYKKYSQRLLELNVRSYLSARGEVNRGITNSINTEPEKFVAYNNGITVTASDIVTVKDENGIRIAKAKNFQIVNGGQTTVSLYRHLIETKSDSKNELERIETLKKISVAMKLLDLGEINETQERNVENISRFSNTQNRVQKADFYSNDPFHIELEKLSRRIIFSDNNQTSKWFYERARGQYEVERNKHRTDAQRKKFDKENPKSGTKLNISQVFNKTDLGKFEMAFNNEPHTVSKGAQAAFTTFMDRYGNTDFSPDEAYYKDLIAKAICWRRMEKIVASNFGKDFRANIITYSISLLTYMSESSINFENLIEGSNLNSKICEHYFEDKKIKYKGYIPDLLEFVRNHLLNNHGEQIITQYAKKEESWKKLKKEYDAGNIPEQIKDIPKIIINSGSKKSIKKNKLDLSGKPNENQQEMIDKCNEVGSDKWGEMASWSKQNNHFEGWQRSQMVNMAKGIRSKGTVSYALAKWGVKFIDEAKNKGFKF